MDKKPISPKTRQWIMLGVYSGVVLLTGIYWLAYLISHAILLKTLEFGLAMVGFCFSTLVLGLFATLFLGLSGVLGKGFYECFQDDD